jgi:hypothetical protein
MVPKDSKAKPVKDAKVTGSDKKAEVVASVTPVVADSTPKADEPTLPADDDVALPEGVEIVPVEGVEPPVVATQVSMESVPKVVAKKVIKKKKPVAEVASESVPEPQPVFEPAVEATPEVAPLAAEVKPVEEVAAAPVKIVEPKKPSKKRSPGRPKAGPLDAPKVAEEPKIVEKGLEEPALDTAVATVAEAAPTAVATVKTKAKKLAAKVTPAAVSSFGRPNADSLSRKTSAPVVKSTTRARDEVRPSGFTGAGGANWILLPIVGLAAVGALVVMVVSGSNLVDLPTRFETAGWDTWSAMLATIILYYYVRGVAASAIAYGEARLGDHRPVPRKHWFSVAINNIGSAQTLDYLGLILQSLPIFGVVALVWYGQSLSSGIDPWFAAAVLTLAFSYLVYMSIILAVSWRLAASALVLGRVNPFKALLLGIGFSLKHFELVVVGVWAIFIESLSLVVPLALVAATLIFAVNSQLWLLAAGVVPLTILAALLEGAYSGAWWQRVYRRLVRHEKLYQALDLLSARSAEKTRPGAAAIFWILLIAIAGVVAAWPWLP